MSNARTAKEAIIEGLFEDADALIHKIEKADKTIQESTVALEKAIGQIKPAAEHATAKAAGAAIDALSGKVADTANAIARFSAQAERAKATTIAASICAVAALTIGAGAFYAGKIFGSASSAHELAAMKIAMEKQAQETAKQIEEVEKAAGWVATPAGKLAKQFADANGSYFKKIARCEADGWQIIKQNGEPMCYPKFTKPGLLSNDEPTAYGWRMPK